MFFVWMAPKTKIVCVMPNTMQYKWCDSKNKNKGIVCCCGIWYTLFTWRPTVSVEYIAANQYFINHLLSYQYLESHRLYMCSVSVPSPPCILDLSVLVDFIRWHCLLMLLERWLRLEGQLSQWTPCGKKKVMQRTSYITGAQEAQYHHTKFSLVCTVTIGYLLTWALKMSSLHNVLHGYN